MDVTFLFLDESVYFDTAWLSGVFVPAEQYADVRDAVVRIARDILLEAGHEHPQPTELHGVDMLRDIRGVTDDHRIGVFQKMVDLVNEERLEVISVGHVEAKAIRRNLRDVSMEPGDKLYSHNFWEIVEALRIPDDVLVQPVFDGVPRQQLAHGKHQPVDRFAYEAFIRGGFVTHWHRVTAEVKPVPWIQYKTNLRNLAEPTFSDAGQSPLLQLADVVGYLLGAAERAEKADGGECSDFKTMVARLGQRIDRTLVQRRSITMHFQPAT